MDFNHKEIEKKWQSVWSSKKAFAIQNEGEKFYVLDMFPYPSGSGLHVGHIEGYTATDIVARFKRMQGFDVLHPFGWDSFGLPAEQFAIATGKDPRDFTYQNIANFKKQVLASGMSKDFDKEFATSDSDYFKWTQFIFKKLYEQDLAELKEIDVNWCEVLGTVLANDEIEIVDGKMISERGGHPVVKKPMKQWILKITKYAERLLSDLDKLEWSDSLKEMQRNWIGKSVGAEVEFTVKDSEHTFNVFTTRVDTLYGATYAVLAPESSLVLDITTEDNIEEVKKYIEVAKSKSTLDRTDLNYDKSGVFTGAYAINPINNKEVPIYIADYVLASYGTGAVMAVPAHDERDYEFAKKYNLEMIKVIDEDITENAYTADGVHINSGVADGLNIESAKEAVVSELEKLGKGKKTVNYRLNDWVFSRQRYWGEPFPVIHYEDGTMELLPDEQLPLELPIMDNIKPSGSGESPLANATEWLNVVREDGVKGRRETNTMPQLAGSSWYFIGYVLKTLDSMVGLDTKEAKELVSKWLPVDLYVGGTEHAVGHLLYARFFTKVLFDIGLIDVDEPFKKLVNQGMILDQNMTKMSKSKGNVVNPDDIIETHGADTLRLYEMFLGPIEADKPWKPDTVDASRRFIDRFYRMATTFNLVDEEEKLDKVYNQTIKKVTEDYERMAFNTAISQMMIFVNEANKIKAISKEQLHGMCKLLNPIAPHITEEINEMFNLSNDILVRQAWPTCDESKLVESEILVVVQVNGKLKAKLNVSASATNEELEKLALDDADVKQNIEGKEIKKVIVIPKKLVNIVAV